jgi:hypothetical protein
MPKEARPDLPLEQQITEAFWTPGPVRDVLRRELYRGQIVSKWQGEEIRVTNEALRIVPEAT